MKRIRFVIALVVVLVLGCLALACFRAREPRYQGRTLSEWIEDGDKAYNNFIGDPNNNPFHPETDPAWQAARVGVQKIGRDAIPFLVRWAQAKDSTLKVKVMDWFDEHSAFHFKIKPAYYYQNKAYFGFRLLESESKPSWPVLFEWASSTNLERRPWAFACLAGINPDKETFLPVLIRFVHDPDNNIQVFAAKVFKDRYPRDAKAAGVYELFPFLKDVPTNESIPTILQPNK